MMDGPYSLDWSEYNNTPSHSLPLGGVVQRSNAHALGKIASENPRGGTKIEYF
jgi:hypothetical protein